MRRLFSIIPAVFFCFSLSAQTLNEKTAVENGLIDVVKKMTLGQEPSSIKSDLLKLAAKDSTDDAVRYYLAICELSLGDVPAAEVAISKACALDPSNDDYQEMLARIYAGTNRAQKASDIYLSLLESKPGKYRGALTLTMLAEKYMYQRQDSLALANYEAALEYDPEYAPAILGKAEIFRMSGNLAAYFSQIRSYTSNPLTDSYTKCSYLDELTKHIDGRTYQVWHSQLDSLINDCVVTHPEDSSALKLAGRWFYGTGDKARGEKLFADFLRLYPECPEAHFINLSLLQEKGDTEGMIRECEQLLAIAGDDREQKLSALIIMGDCYYKIGDIKSAFACYEKALKIDPNDLSVLNNYAYFLCLEGKKLSKAEKMSKVAVEKEPDNATYLDTYGWILHLRGKNKEAKPYFKHAMLYGGKENKEVLFHYAAVLEALGEKELSSYYKGLAESKQ